MLGQIKHGCGCGGSTYSAENPQTGSPYTWNGPEEKPAPAEKPAPGPKK